MLRQVCGTNSRETPVNSVTFHCHLQMWFLLSVLSLSEQLHPILKTEIFNPFHSPSDPAPPIDHRCHHDDLWGAANFRAFRRMHRTISQIIISCTDPHCEPWESCCSDRDNISCRSWRRPLVASRSQRGRHLHPVDSKVLRRHLVSPARLQTQSELSTTKQDICMIIQYRIRLP